MFVILLKFSANKGKAGGAVLAHNATLEQMRAIVDQDPFVAEDVVTAQIVEISATRSTRELEFLISK